MILQLLLKDSNGAEISGWHFQFPSQAVGDAWIAEKVASGVWGCPGGWMILSDNDPRKATLPSRSVDDPAVLDGQGNVIRPASSHMEYNVPADYTATLVDVTAANQPAIDLAQRLQAQAVGAQVLAKTAAINQEKNLQPSAYATIFADANLSAIERLLWTGALGMAKAQMQALSPMPYLGIYSTDDLAALIAIIDGSGLAA